MKAERNPLDDTPYEVRRFKCLRAFTIQKREDSPNEDHWCGSPNATTFALSDGASVSFDPGPWAATLTRRFIENTEISCEWIQAAIAEYSSTHDREVMPWMQQAAFDRGSFATLLGIVFWSNWQGAHVFAIGDSIVAFIDGSQMLRTIPYAQPEEFDRSPDLLSTNPLENRSLDANAISNAWHELNFASYEAPALLLMTDALGRWLLEQPERVSALLEIRDDQAFREFVEHERLEGRLRRDDTTLIIIGVDCELPADH